jgi:hypothetical protein
MVNVLFGRKHKFHVLKNIGLINQKEGQRAVRCESCGKSYIMDMLGGWAIEWNFKMKDEWIVDPDDLAEAVRVKYTTPTREWFQVGQQVCDGKL